MFSLTRGKVRGLNENISRPHLGNKSCVNVFSSDTTTVLVQVLVQRQPLGDNHRYLISNFGGNHLNEQIYRSCSSVSG